MPVIGTAFNEMVTIRMTVGVGKFVVMIAGLRLGFARLAADNRSVDVPGRLESGQAGGRG